MTSKIYINVFTALTSDTSLYISKISGEKPTEKCALRSLQHIKRILPTTRLDASSYKLLLNDINVIHDKYMNSMSYICQLIDWIRAKVWEKTDRVQVEELYQAVCLDIRNHQEASLNSTPPQRLPTPMSVQNLPTQAEQEKPIDKFNAEVKDLIAKVLAQQRPAEEPTSASNASTPQESTANAETRTSGKGKAHEFLENTKKFAQKAEQLKESQKSKSCSLM